MRKDANSSFLLLSFLVSGLLLISFSASCQETSKESPALPDNINAIVNVSCVPCHTSNGGLMSRTKLNFSEWTQYSQKKQKEKAEKMYSELKKGNMPPKSVRETRPEIIPTAEQRETIKKWADSIKPDEE